MSDIKTIVAKNIAQLRQKASMTQMELAQILNYSDKAVSKWERAESMPDIAVLAEIAELFGVSLDYLVKEEHDQKQSCKEFAPKYNRGFVIGISILAVWLIALLGFVLISLLSPEIKLHWLSFVYAVPISLIVWLVLNSVWFNSRTNYFIVSLLMWSVLASVYLSMLPLGMNIWIIFLLGAPAQVIIIFWSKIKDKR
ncbi:MAG: helix-turn-helix domain-containing protein [Clostridia bacterium]|nr:helix-turn-helix domain-containing protein [Clostridia bacterium]